MKYSSSSASPADNGKQVTLFERLDADKYGAIAPAEFRRLDERSQ